MRIVITGASGMLGTDLLQALAGDHELYGLDIRKSDRPLADVSHQILDITDTKATYEVITKINPELVIHAAAYTNVDGAESDQEPAYRINSLGTRNVALSCQRFDAALIYLSTDYVFDGRKTEPYAEIDRPDPLGVYAKSKYWGELYTQWLVSRFMIIRSSWLFGKNGQNFVEAIRSQVITKHGLQVVNDQVGSPTYTVDLAEAIKHLITINYQLSTGLYGIWHITNSGSCSWFDFAREIVKQVGAKEEVSPISASQANRLAVRPKNSVLNNFNWKLHNFSLLPTWQDALKRYLKQ
ncbi:MAG: dTDP-4-dehydrorhamnose reductase [Elusimicrobia bacterium]|nr:dTDP-4-dehydrorhamnose reductase [Elusimicrobiota bacterium]